MLYIIKGPMEFISGLLHEIWGYFCMKNFISTRNCHSHIHESTHFILFTLLKVHPRFSPRLACRPRGTVPADPYLRGPAHTHTRAPARGAFGSHNLLPRGNRTIKRKKKNPFIIATVLQLKNCMVVPCQYTTVLSNDQYLYISFLWLFLLIVLKNKC